MEDPLVSSRGKGIATGMPTLPMIYVLMEYSLSRSVGTGLEYTKCTTSSDGKVINKNKGLVVKGKEANG